MLVTATVLTSCLVSALPLVFGNYDPSNVTATTATTTASVTCTGASSYTLAMNAGTGSGATIATRKMTFGGSTLNYSIYTTGAHTTTWGDGTAGSATVPGTGLLGVTTHTIYGSIPPGQSPNAGAYTDTISITLTY
jgi:spore coat protein U-like protein